MKRVSLTRRLAADAVSDTDIEIVLVKITHDALDGAIYLSSDPTQRLSVEPLIYGTRSAWNNSELIEYLFLPMSAILPGDEDDTPPSGSIVIEAATSQMASVLRSTLEQANVDMAVVLASDTNAIQYEVRDLKLVEHSIGTNDITLTVTRDPITAEPWPSQRMTRHRFPGLFK
jgi:hypothetical protein